MKKLSLFILIALIISFSFIACDCMQEKTEHDQVPLSGTSFDKDAYLKSSESDYELPDYSTTLVDEEPEIEPKNGKTYWYIYFKKDSDWEGFTTIELNTPYFSINQADAQLRKKWKSIKDKDFVGIQFYKQITQAAHFEYQEIE